MLISSTVILYSFKQIKNKRDNNNIYICYYNTRINNKLEVYIYYCKLQKLIIFIFRYLNILVINICSGN
jgi:hypothetical protein